MGDGKSNGAWPHRMKRLTMDGYRAWKEYWDNHG